MLNEHERIYTQDMEMLQSKLFEAAAQGSIDSLRELLQEDPLILDRAVVNCFNETALHVAAMLGHVDFVREIIRLKPHLVNELNSQQSSPLHLASARGHIEVMKLLLSADEGENACFVHDRNTLTPVHLAASKGQVEAVKLLVEKKPEAARLTVNGGDTILHLCVQRYQLETLKFLVEGARESPEFINSKDDEGNTILHLAVADKQVETIKYLVRVSEVDVHVLNNEEMTAIDILIRSRRDMRDSAIEKFLKPCQGFGTSETTKMPAVSRNQNNNGWFEKHKGALTMVVGILCIAIMAFQMGVNTSSIWQEDPTLSHKSLKEYQRVYIANAISFVASLCITILLLISVLPLTRRFFMWIVKLIVRIAFTVALSYVFVRIMLRLDSNHQQTVLFEVVYTVCVWLILMLLLAIHTTVNVVKLGWRN